jgi:hypothetical protein
MPQSLPDGGLSGYSERGFWIMVTESRAEHGLENFGDSLYPYERYGRHDWTRTSDLYRVKVRLFNTLNDFRERQGSAKPL